MFTDEQFLLQRLANASIDIYSMAAVLSRSVYIIIMESVWNS